MMCPGKEQVAPGLLAMYVWLISLILLRSRPCQSQSDRHQMRVNCVACRCMHGVCRLEQMGAAVKFRPMHYQNSRQVDILYYTASLSPVGELALLRWWQLESHGQSGGRMNGYYHFAFF
ncbi:hypothetical protein I7I50_03244 [Histoplasma capsulatum G186AR]|uniref:Secreted protein n=1 Tax=Ajellomyces capsulatus TaxID=5037 RepID=A0A8H7Z1C9_AJECA|nr:hypothetical protein I7I52_00087 [Histoplasma capsulatum]QSS72161.1 hypothetical protein I7I50_03244 [Histoplasma capsulatum G186AR]